MYTRSVRCFLVHLTFSNTCIKSKCSFYSLATEHSYELCRTDFIPPRTKQKPYYASSKELSCKTWLMEFRKHIFWFHSGSSWKQHIIIQHGTPAVLHPLSDYNTILHVGRFAGFPVYFFMWIWYDTLLPFYLPDSGDRTSPWKIAFV
jgi:hypothetical protein